MKRLLAMLTMICLFAISCNNKPTTVYDKDSTRMSDASSEKSSASAMLEKNRATALAAIKAFNSHDADAVLKDVSPDFVDYGDGSGKPVKGLDSCKAMINSYLSAFPDMEGSNLMTVADDNHVAVFGDWSGTFKGKMGNTAPTGKSFKMKDVDLFTFNSNGQITEHRSIQSTESMMMQVMQKK